MNKDINVRNPGVSSRTMMHRKMFKAKEACEDFYILANEQKISHRNVVQQEFWIEQLAEPVALTRAPRRVEEWENRLRR